MAAEEISMGEVIRWLRRLDDQWNRWAQEFEKKQDSQYAMLQNSLTTLTLAFVRADVYEAQQAALRAELESTKNMATWAFRTIAGVVITALVGALLSLGKLLFG